MRNVCYLIFLLPLMMNCQNKADKNQQEFESIEPIVSLMGDTLKPDLMLDSPQEQAYKKAKTNWEQEKNEENYIWLGRRKAYLQHYHEAIAIFSQGIASYPDSYRLYRHRGHRYISTRQLDLATADLTQAVMLIQGKEIEIEADGIPNKLNQPLSNTHFNIFYHLGLAYYLKGDYENAAIAYEKCMEYSVNDDLLVATADWYYMTVIRLGELEKAKEILAQVNSQMKIIENDSYFKRLMMYKGDLSPDSLLTADKNSADFDLTIATQGYGVGNWYLSQGDTVQAKNIFQEVLDGKHWAAFGYIAAESDMKSLNSIN